MNAMIAARLHAFGEPLRLDELPVPEPRPTDVLVEVKACGIVPNLQRVLGNFFATSTPEKRLMPELPAIFGLDPAGVVAAVGSQVYAIRPGDRVYVSPARGCGSCRMCRSGNMLDCAAFTYQGYFGRSRAIMRDYPYGGMAQYITAPPSALVKLPANLSFEGAARFGYIGTAYSGLKRMGLGQGDVLLVNGATGTLGVSACIVALAMGIPRIIAAGRNTALLTRIKALAPDRIETYAFRSDAPEEEAPFVSWVRSVTDGYGVDRMIDCLPPGAPASAMMRALAALRRGGRAVNVGAVLETLPISAFWLMSNNIRLEGSVWFTTAEGEEMAAMAGAGLLDLSVLDHHVFPIGRVNDALAAMADRNGGFSNFVIDPWQV